MSAVHIPFDHERLPPSTLAREIRVGDVQFWGDHYFRVTSAGLSKSGKMNYVEVVDVCADMGHTSAGWRQCSNMLIPWNWNRQNRASAGHAIYRPLAIIREDPL